MDPVAVSGTKPKWWVYLPEDHPNSIGPPRPPDTISENASDRSVLSGLSDWGDSDIGSEDKFSNRTGPAEDVPNSVTARQTEPQSSINSSQGPRRLKRSDTYRVPGSVQPDKDGMVPVRPIGEVLNPSVRRVTTTDEVKTPNPRKYRYYRDTLHLPSASSAFTGVMPKIEETVHEDVPVVDRRPVKPVSESSGGEQIARSCIGWTQLSSPRKVSQSPLGWSASPNDRSRRSRRSSTASWQRVNGSRQNNEPPTTPNGSFSSPTPTTISISSQRDPVHTISNDSPRPAKTPPLPPPMAVTPKSVHSALNARNSTQRSISPIRSTPSPTSLQQRRSSVSSVRSWVSRTFSRCRAISPKEDSIHGQRGLAGQPEHLVCDQRKDLDEWGFPEGSDEAIAGARGSGIPSNGFEASENYWRYLKENKLHPAYIEPPKKDDSKRQPLNSMVNLGRRVLSPVNGSSMPTRDSLHQPRHRRHRRFSSSSYEHYSPISPVSVSGFSFDSGASRREFSVLRKSSTSSFGIPHREGIFEDTAESGLTPLDQYLQQDDMSGLPRSKYPAREILPERGLSIKSAASLVSGKIARSTSNSSSAVMRKLAWRSNGNKLRKKALGSNPYLSDTDADFESRRTRSSLSRRSSHGVSLETKSSVGSSIKRAGSFIFEKTHSILGRKREGGLTSARRKSGLSDWFEKICPKPEKRLQKKRPSAKRGGFGSSRVSVKPG